jgi:hypothetical protein
LVRWGEAWEYVSWPNDSQWQEQASKWRTWFNGNFLLILVDYCSISIRSVTSGSSGLFRNSHTSTVIISTLVDDRNLHRGDCKLQVSNERKAVVFRQHTGCSYQIKYSLTMIRSHTQTRVFICLDVESTCVLMFNACIHRHDLTIIYQIRPLWPNFGLERYFISADVEYDTVDLQRNNFGKSVAYLRWLGVSAETLIGTRRWNVDGHIDSSL